MPHIHTKTGQHDHTASAFIVRLGGNEPKLLLHRHKKLNVYLQFGGHIELNETPWQAVIHELKEESGYEIDQLSVLQPKQRITKLTRAILHPQPINYNTHAFNDAHFHTDVAYGLVTKEAPRHKPLEHESRDLRLFTRNELLDLSDKDIFENIRETGIFILDIALINWVSIPAVDFEA